MNSGRCHPGAYPLGQAPEQVHAPGDGHAHGAAWRYEPELAAFGLVGHDYGRGLNYYQHIMVPYIRERTIVSYSYIKYTSNVFASYLGLGIMTGGPNSVAA